MACRNLPSTDRGGVRTITVNRPGKLNALDQGLAGTQTFALCFASTDLREGTRAFLERRKPVSGGR